MSKTVLILFCLMYVDLLGATVTIQEDQTDEAFATTRLNSVNIYQLIYFEREVLANDAIGGVERFISSPDAFFACRARWEIVVKLASDAKDGQKVHEAIQQEVAEFKDFVREKLGVVPPKDWMHFLQYGRLPKIIESGRMDNLRAQKTVKLDDEIYLVDVDTFLDPGEIKHVDGNGKTVWSTEFFSFTPYADGFVGHAPRALWFKLEKTIDGASLLLWGVGPSDAVYVVKFDAQTGRRENFLYLSALVNPKELP